ncbi:hypothetical protein F966_03332 [Acinetobacter higginsii]|uniref:Uncharacterized protein n=1 Tax=Acinetobacter higginsii TaxID=70347 RepID=N8XMI8_9GAMM|nr:hypothetical protein F966_03332 [Acinetobacter higginsii]
MTNFNSDSVIVIFGFSLPFLYFFYMKLMSKFFNLYDAMVQKFKS